MKVKELIETLQELNQPNANIYITHQFMDKDSDIVSEMYLINGVVFRPNRNPDTVEIVC